VKMSAAAKNTAVSAGVAVQNDDLQSELLRALVERNEVLEEIPVQTDTTARHINAVTTQYCCICNEKWLTHLYEGIAVADALSGDAMGFVIRDAGTGKTAATVIVSVPSAVESKDFLMKAGAPELGSTDYVGWIKIVLLCTAAGFRTGEGTLALTYAIWWMSTKHGYAKSFLEIGSGINNIKAYGFYRRMLYSSIADAKPYMMWNLNHTMLLSQMRQSIRKRSLPAAVQTVSEKGLYAQDPETFGHGTDM